MKVEKITDSLKVILKELAKDEDAIKASCDLAGFLVHIEKACQNFANYCNKK